MTHRGKGTTGWHRHEILVERTLTCRWCQKPFTGQFRACRTVCPACTVERKRVLTLKSAHEAYLRNKAEREALGLAPNMAVFKRGEGVRYPQCSHCCEHWDWCCDHVLSGEALPCAPNTGVADCRADMRIDPLSKQQAFVMVRERKK